MDTFCGLWALYYTLQWVLLARQGRAIQQQSHALPAGFENDYTADDQLKATRYGLAKLRLARLELLVEALVLLMWIVAGGLARLDHALEAWMPNTPPTSLSHGVALTLTVLAVGMVIDWPFAAYRTFGLEARFGFNQSTVGLFVKDQLLSIGLGLLLGVPLLVFVLWAMASLGPNWWWVAYLVFVGFSLTLTLLYPTVIAPLFNQFKPLDDPALKARIDQLLADVGFKAKGVFVMDGSRRSTHGNAYFTGFGQSKRIVFYDTLLERLNPDELRAVLAHELGHFKLNHIRSQLLISVALLGVGFWVLGQLSQSAAVFTSVHLSLSPGMLLVVGLLALQLISWPLQPLQNALSRRHEYEADAFAAQHSSSQQLASALKKLVRDNASCLVPDPWYARFFASHPSVVERVRALGA